jgi:hypothetical protein
MGTSGNEASPLVPGLCRLRLVVLFAPGEQKLGLEMFARQIEFPGLFGTRGVHWLHWVYSDGLRRSLRGDSPFQS